jgi:hypothetical protein
MLEKRQVKVLVGNFDDLMNDVFITIIKQVINDRYELKITIACFGDHLLEVPNKESIDLYILVMNNIYFSPHQLPESWEKSLQFITQIKTKYKRPVIALSSWLEDTALVEKTKEAADFFFSMPFKIDAFKEAVEKCLQRLPGF